MPLSGGESTRRLPATRNNACYAAIGIMAPSVIIEVCRLGRAGRLGYEAGVVPALASCRGGRRAHTPHGTALLLTGAFLRGPTEAPPSGQNLAKFAGSTVDTERDLQNFGAPGRIRTCASTSGG